jgi:hypothetical protein
VPAEEAGAGVVVDNTAGFLAEVLFGLIALGVLLVRVGVSSAISTVAIGLATSVALVALVILVERFGLLGRAVGSGHETRRGIWARLLSGAGRLDRAIRELYAHPGALIACAAFRLLSSFAGALELDFGLLLLGQLGSPTDGIVLNGLITLVRSAAFLIPAGIGVQEGGFVVLGQLIGLGPDSALALALMVRVRETALGLPGVAAAGSRMIAARAGRSLDPEAEA